MPLNSFCKTHVQPRSLFAPAPQKGLIGLCVCGGGGGGVCVCMCLCNSGVEARRRNMRLALSIC